MFFLMVAWIWTIIAVIGDVFRSKDLSGAAKALSVLLIIVIPWLGVLGYILVRGGGMEERRLQALTDAKEAQRTYIQDVAGNSTADELSKLSVLKEKGVITDTEFEAQKTKLLA